MLLVVFLRRPRIWPLVFVAACKDACGSAPRAEGPAAASSAATPIVADADPLDEKLRHCPLTVEAATAVLADDPRGIRITVTASDDAAVLEIRRRVAHLQDVTRRRVEAGVHGKGQGGGTMRNCPIVTTDTLVTGTDVPHGSEVLVEALDAARVQELRDETRRRRSELPK